MLKKILYYAQLMRLDKPIGILLLLWPTLWAVWLASRGFPSLPILVTFILGTIIMRSAGCVINDYADQHFDSAVTRTKQRPLATKKITNVEALGLFILLTGFAACLAWQLNAMALKLAFMGFLITLIYPFTKRFFIMPQFILGFAFAWGFRWHLLPLSILCQLLAGYYSSLHSYGSSYTIPYTLWWTERMIKKSVFTLPRYGLVKLIA